MKIREHNEARASEWAQKFSLSEPVSRILSTRFNNEAELQLFLKPSLEQLHSPFLLPDIDTLIGEVENTIKKKEPILLYGHEDVDGFSAVTVLYEVLTDLGAKVFYHIPSRTRDGYFFNPNLLEGFKKEGVNTILTADFGSSNLRNLEIARAAGMTLLVTDHHEIVHENIPTPTINPKRSDSRYPFRELAGVGVAYKTAQALAHRLLGVSIEEFYAIKHDVFGAILLGTISDRVPLISENRVFCRLGLEALGNTTRPVLRRLIDGAVVRREKALLESFNYAVIFDDILPLISSARENQGVEVFIIKNDTQALEMVKTLKRQNEQWQTQIHQAYDEAFTAARVYDRIVFSLLVNGPIDCLGSCATRLRDNFNRSSVVIGFSEGSQPSDLADKNICIGELRGDDSADLVTLLKSMQDILIDFGGHRKAAGFSMHRSCVDEFIERARFFAEEHFIQHDTGHQANKIQNLIADLVLPVEKIDDSFKLLLPFGEGNPAPIFYDEAGIVYTIDEDLNPIDPVRFTKIVKHNARVLAHANHTVPLTEPTRSA